MTEVKLTDIFDLNLTLTEDRMGCWTLKDSIENEIFVQSEDQCEAWTEHLIIYDGSEWVPLDAYLEDLFLISDVDYKVRASMDTWIMAHGAHQLSGT